MAFLAQDPRTASHESADLTWSSEDLGAREMIFMNFLARSSRATGPKMRVPMGSLWALIRTALLASNLM